PAPKTITPPVRPVPKPTTSRIPPGADKTDKIATETPSKVTGVVPDAEADVVTVITLPEKVKISALIELVGKQLKINYMYDITDAKLINSEVFLKLHDGRIKVKDMYTLLESVLKSKGYAMMRRGNLVTVMKSTEALNLDPDIREGVDDGQLGRMIVTTVFKLEHISTATAQAMLKNMKLGLLFNAIEETKTLMVTGYAYRMARMEEVLNMVDVPGKERKFRSRKLEYLLPSELAQKVMSLAQELGTITITISAKPAVAARPAPVRPGTRTPLRPPTVRPPTATSKAAADKGVYLDTDDRTNRVLMIGLEEDIETVDMLIDSLDVARYDLKSVKEYAMQYVQATEILNTLGELGVISSAPRTSMASRLPTTSTRLPTTTRTTTSRTTTSTRLPTSYGAARPVEGEPQISIRLATNSLLVNATPEQHAEIEMLIRFVDVEQKDVRTVQEYEIQYVDINEVVDTLAELGIVEQSASSASSRRTGGYTSASSRLPTGARTSTTAAAAAPAVATTTFEATTGAEIMSEQPQIAVLESTNSLLVYATPKQHDTIALIVAHVDRELTETSTPYVVYALENQDPEELAATLNEIIQATVEDVAKSAASKITTKAPATAGIPPKRERNEIQIVADPKTYSIVVYADKKNQQWINALIEELDAYRPQVLLDVTLAEITRTDDFELDLQSAIKTAGGSTFNLLSSISTASGGLATGSLLTTFPGGSVSEATSISGQGFGFFADKHVQFLIEAIQTKNYGRILSRPTLLVDDNQEGTLDAKETTYIERESTIVNPGTSSGTSTTSTNTIFESYDAGISLAIKPHISKGNNLRLEITLSQSDFTESTTNLTKPPNTATNDIVTVVTVPDSSTIILGGLEKIKQSKGGTKVPLLGDIPLLGGLFRSTNNKDTQKKLYVFIKARIMRPGTDLSGRDLIDISKKSRTEFEAREDEMQTYEDWPGIKPKPMDPLHVLEEDEYIQELKNGLHKDTKAHVEVKLDSSGETNGSY
ncbi:MAG: hypothetical protein J7M40_04580, partial [Planctomycetes bacterium]|nr:hypothetical protein [Planctomycetota bacterium]